MDEQCEICKRRTYDRLLGIVADPGLLLPEKHISLDKDSVVKACDSCATKKIEAGVGREMPLGEGDAAEIWYHDRFELTDGVQSITKKHSKSLDNWK